MKQLNQQNIGNYFLFEDYEFKKNKIELSKSLPILSMKRKCLGLFQLTRPQNIIPVVLLNLLGACITNPSFQFPPSFFVLMWVTQLETASSMVINDVVDCEQDKINHPDRPIPLGLVSKREAWIFFSFLTFLSLYLNQKYIQSTFVMIDFFLIRLYTSFFKKIPFVKNLVCAFVVSNSVYLSGVIAAGTNDISLSLMMSTLKILFSNSLFLEIVLDMVDREGDKNGGIVTLPVLLGNDLSMVVAFVMVSFGMLDSIGSLGFGGAYSLISLCLSCMFVSLAMHVKHGMFERYTKKSISKIIDSSSYHVFFYFLSVFITQYFHYKK
jgi:geranylgeranylglycerol-phosphate geranylgeranyltransferase